MPPNAISLPNAMPLFQSWGAMVPFTLGENTWHAPDLWPSQTSQGTSPWIFWHASPISSTHVSYARGLSMSTNSCLPSLIPKMSSRCWANMVVDGGKTGCPPTDPWTTGAPCLQGLVFNSGLNSLKDLDFRFPPSTFTLVNCHSSLQFGDG